MVGHAVLGPGGEVELTHLVLGWVTTLNETHKKQALNIRRAESLQPETLQAAGGGQSDGGTPLTLSMLKVRTV